MALLLKACVCCSLRIGILTLGILGMLFMAYQTYDSMKVSTALKSTQGFFYYFFTRFEIFVLLLILYLSATTPFTGFII